MTCTGCEKEFTPKKASSQYCSSKCSHNNNTFRPRRFTGSLNREDENRKK